VPGLSSVNAPVYAYKRREALSRLLTADGEPDLDAIEEQFATFDAEFGTQRASLVAWLTANAGSRG
jgi:hypothetical protein